MFYFLIRFSKDIINQYIVATENIRMQAAAWSSPYIFNQPKLNLA